MGTMADGVWITDASIAAAKDGAWQRAPSVLRGVVTAKDGPYNAEQGRYHLYAAWNCPWAHRALLGRVFKGLEGVIGVSFCAPRRTEQGWVFGADYPDDLHDSSALHELYAQAVSDYSGRVTVPILWDTQTQTIVSNESADILRMMGSAWNEAGANDLDLYPATLRHEIDGWNDRIHAGLNNGVYRAGFAETQAAYDAGVASVFETLDLLEARLQESEWIVGSQITEADLRLFPTLVRFDIAYHGAFKCNIRRLIDYPALWQYARRLYAMPGIAQTVRFDIYKAGYWSISAKRNPLGIVPAGPELDWTPSN